MNIPKRIEELKAERQQVARHSNDVQERVRQAVEEGEKTLSENHVRILGITGGITELSRLIEPEPVAEPETEAVPAE